MEEAREHNFEQVMYVLVADLSYEAVVNAFEEYLERVEKLH